MTYKKLQSVFIFLFLTIYSNFYSQEKFKITFGDNQQFYNKLENLSKYEPEIIPDFFILGTLSDNMGRFHDFDPDDDQLDYYHKDEKPIVEYLIKDKFNLIADSSFNGTHYKISSQKLAKIINSYYNENGELLATKFKTDKQVYSFLLGRHFRVGTKISDSIYKIELENAWNTDILYSLLKEIHCPKTFYRNDFFEYSASSYESFYFEPNPKLKLYLGTLEKENANNYQYYLNSHFDNNELRDEQIKDDSEESIKIKMLFDYIKPL